MLHPSLFAAVLVARLFGFTGLLAAACVGAFLAARPALAQSGSGATIIGQVSNVATGSYLQGAVVSATGTQRSAITDREGRFELRDLPAGPLTLAVSYTGLDPQEFTVTVAAGQRVVRDIGLTSKIYQMEKFSVAGEREGTALAETLQRQAPNVKNVVSSDTFGNVADGNVGDLLQHVVGITADYNGPDVRQVSIRGVSSALSSVTMDGQHMATAQSSGLGRSFEFEQASLGNIETIEVTKAATPDMEGSSIGGSINMVTKSAFDRAVPRRLDYTIGFATRPYTLRYNNSSWWKMPVAGYGPSLNFSFTDVIGADRRIGVTLNGMVHSLPWGGGQSGLAFERRATPGPVYTWQTRRVDVGPTRSRAATGVKLDYRWSDQTTVSFNTSYNYFHENGDTRTNTLEYTARQLATVDVAGNRTGVGRPAFGSIIPNESIDDNTQRITISNPNLVPQEANNYDFTLEYYFRPQGMISAGVFAKRIKNYIYTDSSQIVPTGANNGFQGQYEGYGITTSANGGRARINGLELNYQQQLTFLPGWMKGFGVYANFTKLETTGDNSGPSTTAGGTLAGFLNKTGNLGVSYRGYGFDIRPQAVYRGSYLVSTSTDPSLVTYQRAKTTWSIKSRYALNRHLSVFLDLENLFSEPVSLTYALYSDRVILDYQFPTKIVGGLTGRF